MSRVAARPPVGEEKLGWFATCDFVLSQSQSPSHRIALAQPSKARAEINAFAIRLQTSGRLSGNCGSRTIAAHDGDVVVLDLSQTLDLNLTAPAGGDDTTLWIARSKVLAMISQDDLLHGLVVSGASPIGAMIGGALKALAEQAPKSSAEDMDALCEGVLALLAKALAPELARRSATGARPSASFVTIRRHIDQHLHQPSLNADSLAKRFGLSRASLYRLFEPVGGVALYIRKARLARAYQEIVSRDDSSHRIGPIAYRMGFKNVSAFSRLFKDHFGVTPGEAREQSGLAASPAPAADEDADDQETLAYWLRRLGAPPRASAEAQRPEK